MALVWFTASAFVKYQHLLGGPAVLPFYAVGQYTLPAVAFHGRRGTLATCLTLALTLASLALLL